ncbi:diguanylate cyclase [Legionella brunensis]|uniref:diguanylate cyclase n=1 Tax=Legionella brunensis TaxID=29422 RepID=A0A0W0SNH6_9GAMM|nr:diguanylate cyclase [Legionella brunensis]KTC84967.1 regulatory protein (GGDEF domain) [Legionella brunensis]
MTNNIQEKLNRLLIKYNKNLPTKLNKIQTQWQELLDQWSVEKLTTLHRDIHSLCGSSATYGYKQLSQIARQAEILLKKLLEGGEASDAEKNQISTYLLQLKTIHTETHSIISSGITHHQASNNLVYVLEKNTALVKEVSQMLLNMDYNPYSLDSTMGLELALREEPPIAIIINSSYLDNEVIDFLKKRQHTEQSIPLFCLIPNSELYPRLLAIRANCDAFFQLPFDKSYFAQIFQSKCNTSTESFRILVVDDSESLAEYYTLILTKAGMITRALTNPMELLNELKSFQPDLILMDIYMPECTGLELAAVLRKEKNYTKLPIIFLSTEDDRNKILFAMSLGGDDFLCKPVSPAHLVSAVRSRARRASALNYYMITDSLTGLLNHSSVLTQLDIELARIKQKKGDLLLIMIDIDYFKKINDNYGHPAGDKVLKQLANLFLVNLRNQDIIGRYGGEEFLIILPGTSLTHGMRICNHLRLQFNRFLFKEQNRTFNATFSAGISYLKENEEASLLIQEADKALYEAKDSGRNKIVSCIK